MRMAADILIAVPIAQAVEPGADFPNVVGIHGPQSHVYGRGRVGLLHVNYPGSGSKDRCLLPLNCTDPGQVSLEESTRSCQQLAGSRRLEDWLVVFPFDR